MRLTKPYFGEPWGRCGTCGIDVPVSCLALTRKMGWQCLPGSVTRGCVGENYDRDDIQYLPPSGEGTRRTAAPIVVETDGIGPYETFDRAVLYDRAAPATKYLLTFAANIGFGVVSTTVPAVGALLLNNGWVLYIKSGFLRYGQQHYITDSAPLNPMLTLYVDAKGFQHYTPVQP